MNGQEATQIAKKVLEGRADAAEKAALQAYIDSHPDKEKLLATLFPVQDYMGAASGSLPEGMEDRVLNKVLNRQGRTSVIPAGDEIRRTEKSGRTFWVRVAAAAAVLFAFLIPWYWIHYKKSAAGTENPEFAFIQAEAGHLKHLVLEDGTRIVLNGGSSLRWPKQFAVAGRVGGQREVYLDGEAFFDVAKDSLHPFLIHSPLVTTTVLGTSFNIRAIRSEGVAEVAVATGKVKVALDRDSGAVVLTPGRQATAGTAGGFRERAVDIAAVGAWKDHWFYFDQTPLKEILASLERAYGVRFRVADPQVLTCTYSSTFKNISIGAILETLSLMSNVHFTRKNDYYEVTGRACR